MRSLVIFHSDTSGAAKSILFLKNKKEYLFQKVTKNTTIFNSFRLALFFIKGLFVRNLIFNGLGVIANPWIQIVLKFLPRKRIILYWHEGEFQWNETINFFNIDLGKLREFIEASHNICDSVRVKNWVAMEFALKKTADVLYECIDTSKSNPPVIVNRGTKVNVLCVGNLCSRKGFDDFLLLADKESNNINFKWVGRKVEYNQARKEKVKEINQKSGYTKVVVEGYSNEPSKLYQESNAFLLPSIDEPFGIVYLEALLHGNFVIASPNSGFSEVLKDNSNVGYVYKNNTDLLDFVENRLVNNLNRNELQEECHLFAKLFGITQFHINLNKLISKYENEIIT